MPRPADTARPSHDDYALVASADQFDAAVYAVRRAGRVALGTKPIGSDPMHHRPRLLQLATPDGKVFLLDLTAIGDMTTLAQALGDATVIAHNALYHLKVLRQHYGVTPHTAYCTRTAARLLDGGLHAEGNRDDYSSLANLYERHLGVHTCRDPQSEDWTGRLTLPQLQSAASDVRELPRLHDSLAVDIAKDGLELVYTLECKLLPVLVDMDMAGVGVNKQRWCDLVSERRAGMLRLKARLLQQLGNVNPDSYPQVKTALHALGCDMDGMSAETLAPYLNRPYVQDLLDYHSVASFVRGPGKEILEILQAQGEADEGNRVHASIDPCSAVTGRLSCSKPNLMGLPKDAAVRGCIEPSSGYLFVSADIKAADLRVVAHITQDQRLLEVFRRGDDPHTMTAALLLNKPESEVTDRDHDTGKIVNLGLLNGMGADTLVVYAYERSRVTMTLDEATRFRDRFLAAYPGIAQWQDAVSRSNSSVVRTASGRLRKFADPANSYCARLNTAVQGTGADALKLAMILLHERLPAFRARLILTVHDEVLVEAPADVAEQVKSVVVLAMKEGMREFVPTVPISVKATIRRTWAETDAG
ncbi:MAG: DNA polymerase [Polyangia bacterium]